MKRYFLLLSLCLLVIALSVQTNAKNPDNPFLKEWNTPFKTPPFNTIKLEHFLPAFELGIKQQTAEINTIVSSKEKPTFTNTIEVMEKCGSLLVKVNRVFSALNSANTNDDMQKLAEKVTSLLSKQNDDIYLNEKLFKRVKTVYDEKDKINLSTEQKTVLGNYYLDFTGVGLILITKIKIISEKLMTSWLNWYLNLAIT